MAEGEESNRDWKEWLPAISKWLGVVGLATLLFFVVTAFIHRHDADFYVEPAVTFSQNMGETLAFTFGGIGGLLFQVSSLCSLGALFTGIASLSPRTTVNHSAKVGLSLAATSMLITVAVALFINARDSIDTTYVPF